MWYHTWHHKILYDITFCNIWYQNVISYDIMDEITHDNITWYHNMWYHVMLSQIFFRLSYDIIHDPAGHWFHATSHYCDIIVSEFLLITWHQLWYTLISPKISHYSDIICDFIAKITWIISQEGVRTSIYTDITYDIMCAGKLFLWCHLIS